MTTVIGAIQVELLPQELILFKMLYDAGVFNTRNGKVILNFDADGTLTQIDTNVVTYKRGKLST